MVSRVVGRKSFQALTAGLALAVVVSATLALGACDSPTNGTGISTSPNVSAAPDLPPLMVTACFDRTPSFDRGYFNDAKNMLADAITQRATMGQLGATIYVTLIGHNSYASGATVRTIVMPATPHNVAASGTPANNNPYDDPTATAAARSAATATAIGAQAAQLKQQLQPDISFLRSLNPPTDSPTDILGCVSRASERFQAAPAGTQKLLIMATDLQQAGPQQADPSRLLPGVHVKVIEWKCDDAANCDSLKKSWHDEFISHDQAASVTYFDPGETQAQLAGHLFDTNS